MKALVLREVGTPIEHSEFETPSLQENEALVKITAAALNHRDLYITQGLYPGIVPPVILGSDGVGTVVQATGEVSEKWLNKRVVINPSIGWDKAPLVQPSDYHIVGLPTNGTFADYIKVGAEQLYEVPAHLSDEEAAALPLAGLTAYRALFSRAQATQKDRVLISGVGGGVALFACQFAIAMGAEVYVTSGSQEKIDAAIALGAKGGVSYKEENWHKTLKKQAGGGFDVIIDSAGGEGFKYFLDLANPGGRIAFYGGTKGNFKINPQKMFWKQLSIFGSTMGNSAEFGEMLHFVSEKQIKPVVDSVWSMDDGAEAFGRMDAGKQFGKIVLKNT